MMETATQPTVNCAFVYPATGEQCDIPKATHERKVKNHEFVAPAPRETPAQHSPLPWSLGDFDWHVIVGADSRFRTNIENSGRIETDGTPLVSTSTSLAAIAVIEQSNNEAEDLANAQFIVKCVNRSPAFQKLVEALEALKPYLATKAEMLDYASLNEGRAGGFDTASMKAREALRLAREGEKGW